MTTNFLDNNIHWFAANTKPRQEKFIKNRLQTMGIDHFIPTRFEVRQWKYRKKRVELPIIPHLVFIHTDFATSFSLPNDHKFEIWYIRDRETRTSLIVPDKQMEDFMRIINSQSEEVEIVTTDFTPGDKVRVIDGAFVGIEGVLEQRKDKNRVVVSLQGLVAASVNIPMEYLERIKEK